MGNSTNSILGLAVVAVLRLPAAQAEEAARDELEIVVVTAQKHEQQLQDVPLSLSVLGQETLQRAQVQSFADYAVMVPNLSFSFGGSTQNDGRNGRGIAIRGIAGSSTVGLYVDDTPVPDNLDPNIAGIERIEVLRGPQGTLYGSASMGGTVRLITRQPDLSRFDSSVEAILSSTGEGGSNTSFEAAVNVPIVAGSTALRVSGFHRHDSGVFDRRVTNPGGNSFLNEDVDSQDIWGGQVALTFAPTLRLTITPRVLYQRQEADGAPWADVRPDAFEQARTFNVEEPLEDRWTSSSLTVKYDADWASFVSSTSYFDRDLTESEDETEVVAYFLGNPPIPSTVTEDLRYQRFVQEARLVTTLEGPVQFTAGVYFDDLKVRRLFDALTPGLDAAYSASIGLPPGQLKFGTDQVFSLDSFTAVKEKAAFGELTYSFTDRLRATAGLRWFEASQDRTRSADGIFNGGVRTTVAGHATFDGVNPKFRFEFDATDDLLLFATASKGYRLGGLNGTLPPSCNADLNALGITQPQKFEPDTLWNYEVGARSTLLGRRLALNGAIFRIDWTDIQQSQLLIGCGFAFTGNAGEARSQGVEVDVNWRALSALNLSLGLGYTDAKFTRSDPSLAAAVDDRVLQIPKLNANASATYTFALGNVWEGYLRGDYAYVGESYTSFDQRVSDPGFERARVRAAYSLADFSVGAQLDTWELQLFMKNAFNEHANLSDTRSLAAELPGRPRYATNRPRTVGLSVRKSF